MNVKPWSTVGPGADSQVVTGIQYLLRARGHAVVVDGQYGPATADAVTAFQSGAGLTADGIVGPQTWPALVVTTQSGSTGDAVRAVQQFGLVSSPGLDALVVDGTYGPITVERVRFFQESWGLTIDGQAGPETWSFLSTFLPGPRPWPLVKQGATQTTNWRVRAAQYLLRAHGSGITADGVFGPASGAAVKVFQHSLRTSEISTTLGQLDWPHLIVTVSPGSSGDAVRALQTLLPHDLVVDGSFGPATEAEVRDFQQTFAPPNDGIVGPITWHALTLRIFD
jgi:peptidoglycan hydrolase-like protein with peptidoglycan-binding domain